MQLSVACNLILEGVADAIPKVDYLGTDACWIAVCVLCRNAQAYRIVVIILCIVQ